MKAKEIAMFESILLDRKEQILSNLTIMAKEMSSTQRDDLKDEADHASASEAAQKSDAISLQQRAELEEIEYSIGKIKKGTFGICDMCEEQIGIPRLKAKPFAKYCIVCREIVEKERGIGRKRG
jgi:DnaK suppressor protein